VSTVDEVSPVRTAIANFGEAAMSPDGQSFQVELPKLTSSQLKTAIDWVEAHCDSATGNLLARG